MYFLIEKKFQFYIDMINIINKNYCNIFNKYLIKKNKFYHMLR